MDNYKKLLKKFLSFKSISADSTCKNELIKTADWLAQTFKSHGFKTKIVKGFGNPIVVASYEINPKATTYLIYGHYDVQPAHKSDGWSSDPFTLTEKKGRLVGRGSADNKGQVLLHISAIFDLIKEKRLAVNVKFMIEGNEETGSPKLRSFLEKNKTLLKSDYIIISDGEIYGNSPTLEAGFRGVFNAEISLETSKKELHSGLFGGAVPNAGTELVSLLSKVHGPKGEILIPGYEKHTQVVLDKIEEPFDNKSFNKLTGCLASYVSSHEELTHKTGLSNTIQITGLKLGYTGEGFRNSVPAKAVAKVNVRIAPSHDPIPLVQEFKKFLVGAVLPHVKLQVTVTEHAKGALLDTNSPIALKAKKILEEIYKKKLRVKYCGGTLPIVNDFAEVLETPQVMIPLANEDCGMHSADENMTVACAKKGMEFSKKFFSQN